MGFFKDVLGPVAPIIGAVGSFIGGERANAASAASVEKQLAFQEKAYRNRYQWQVEDMRKAGINPMLSVSQGAPAGPAGASYKAQDTVTPAVQSAMAMRRLGAEIRVMDSQAQKNAADAALADNKNISEYMLQQNIQETLKEIASRVDQNRSITRINKETLSSAQATAAAARIEEEFWKSPAGKILKQLDLTGSSLNPFAKAGNSAKALVR